MMNFSDKEPITGVFDAPHILHNALKVTAFIVG